MNARRVMVVEDNTSTRAMIEQLLDLEGYDVSGYGDGATALQHINPVPSLILLDVMMPGMDGFEVCSLLRSEERTRHLPIILLTARDDMDTRLEGMYHGVSEFLTKPINKHELFARVRAQLHIRNLTQQLETVERSLETARQGRPATRPAGRG